MKAKNKCNNRALTVANTVLTENDSVLPMTNVTRATNNSTSTVVSSVGFQKENIQIWSEKNTVPIHLSLA